MVMEREEQASKTHIMVIPLPFQGHMSPMIQFSKRLAAKGVRVTLVASTSSSEFIHAQATSSINIEYISYDPDEGNKPDTVKSYMAHIERRVSQNLPGLMEKQKSSGYPVKVLVHDSLMPWAIDFGHRLGLPVAIFFTQACAVSAIYYHVHQGTLMIPLEGSTFSLPSIPVLGVTDLPACIYDGLYPGSLDIHLNQFSDLHKADWIFFNTFDKLEYEVAKWLSSQWPIKTIGPTVPSMYLDKRLADDKDYGLSLFKPDAEACMKWLDTKNTASVVYVSFGSLANLGQDHMDEVAWGLLGSNSNFLWVVRDSEQSKLPSNFMAEAAEKGLVVGWCPQLEVLAHEAVGSFMTYCGWNSTIEALSLGVAMLVMPQQTDQTTNAKYVVDVWRTGARVKAREKGIATREEIVVSVNDIMEGAKGKELRANAARWKELGIEAVDEGGSSDKNIDEFISKLVSA